MITNDLGRLFRHRYGSLAQGQAHQAVWRCDGGYLAEKRRWAAAAVSSCCAEEETCWYYSGEVAIGSNWQDQCAEGMSWIAALEVMLNSVDAETHLKGKGIVLYVDRLPHVDNILSQRVMSAHGHGISDPVRMHPMDTCNWRYLLILNHTANRICDLLLDKDRILCIAMRENDPIFTQHTLWQPDLCCTALMQDNPPAAFSPPPFADEWKNVQMAGNPWANRLHWTKEKQEYDLGRDHLGRDLGKGKLYRYFLMDKALARDACQSLECEYSQ